MEGKACRERRTAEGGREIDGKPTAAYISNYPSEKQKQKQNRTQRQDQSKESAGSENSRGTKEKEFQEKKQMPNSQCLPLKHENTAKPT
jgi:hypothetical protein